MIYIRSVGKNRTYCSQDFCYKIYTNNYKYEEKISITKLFFDPQL